MGSSGLHGLYYSLGGLRSAAEDAGVAYFGVHRLHKL